MDLPLLKNINFSNFLLSCFYSLESCIFVVEYYESHFPGLILLIKKVGKMANFRPRSWTNPFGKCQFFLLLELFDFIV